MRVSLRNYQEVAVDFLRGNFMLGHRSVLFVLPTGGGKTVIFCHISEEAARKGNRICILVHRQELVDQTSRSLNDLGVAHGIIAAGTPMDLTHSVQVASVQTLVRRLHKIPNDYFQLLVVDEAHHAVAGSWAKVLDHYSTAKVLGVTATPLRLDGRGLKDKFTSLVVGPNVNELTAKGFLAPARVFAPPVNIDLKRTKKRAGDYALEEIEPELLNPTFTGDVIKHFKKHLTGSTALAFCASIQHTETMADLFNDAGIKAAAINGTMSKDERRELLRQLGTGEIQVLTSCQIISEGTDVPSVGGCLLLRPTKSLSLYLQQVGRCLRPSPGKAAAIILDHVGNVREHNVPWFPHVWSLEGKPKKEAKDECPITVCPDCYSVCPSGSASCPFCGCQLKDAKGSKMNYSDDDLVELTSEMVEEIQAKLKEKNDKRREIGRARSIEELLKLAEDRGYKPGWAHHIHNSRQTRRYGRQ